MSEAPGGKEEGRDEEWREGQEAEADSPRSSPTPQLAPHRPQGVRTAALHGQVATFGHTATSSGPPSQQERGVETKAAAHGSGPA